MVMTLLEREAIASQAHEMGLAALCAIDKSVVVTGLTAAVLRGWTSAATHTRHVAVHPFAASFIPAEVVRLEDEDSLWRSLTLTDARARPYRVADPVRTLVDLAAGDAPSFLVAESFAEARGEVDHAEVVEFAAARSPDLAVRVKALLAG